MGRSKTIVADGVHLIKKYPNRKLYSVILSQYVTFDEIAKFVVSGDDVRVVENDTGKDISGEILLLVLTEREKLHAHKSAKVYKQIIQNHECLGDLL